MELYEKINIILKEKDITKKEFIGKFLLLEPRLKSTGEIPNYHSVYAYLNGKRELKVELIPYIAEALNVTEQELFDNNKEKRLEYLKSILKNPTKKELKLINETFYKNHQNDETTEELLSLLPYASKPFIQNIIEKLKAMRRLATE